jgi:glutamyl-tRNA reductase
MSGFGCESVRTHTLTPKSGAIPRQILKNQGECGSNRMHIHCLGVNHQTAELSLREKLAFTEEEIQEFYFNWRQNNARSTLKVDEILILSTCNRVEIYAVAEEWKLDQLENFLCTNRKLPSGELEGHLYMLEDEEAIDHLFRVAAGLDSLVLGEPQILGQVARSYHLAQEQGVVGPVLSRLLQTSLHTGKRARNETAISQSPTSIASAAIRLVEDLIPGLPAASIGILGAGEMSELVASALLKHGGRRFSFFNRTFTRARELAARLGGTAFSYSQLAEQLENLDVLIASTGAPDPLVTYEMVRSAMACRSGRRLVLIDIAVPRDIEEAVRDIPNVYLYDFDSLQRFLEKSLAERRDQIPRVEAILVEEREEFMNYLSTLEVVPLISAIHQQAEEIRKAELEKTLRHLPNLTVEDRQRLDALTSALVKKLLHAPINHLREEAGTPNAAQATMAARSLFGLDGSPSLHSNSEGKY